jgi:hypothetical protein
MFEQATQILEKWLEAVNAGDFEGVVSLYNEIAVLLPTFSNRRLKTPAEIRSYFDALKSHKNLSVTLHPDTVIVQRPSEALQCIGGLYCWRFDVENELLNFEARFTFVVDLTLGAPILHHHSSQVPRMV